MGSIIVNKMSIGNSSIGLLPLKLERATASRTKSLAVKYQLLTARLRNFKPWLEKGIWAIIDQGLFAVSNFLVSILLARWLTLEGYGAFSIAFAIFLLLGNLYTALFIEPMLVFGAGKYKSRFIGYLKVLLHGHIRFAALAAILMLSAGFGFWLFDAEVILQIFLALSFAAPAMLLLWLLRRACYVQLAPQKAALAGTLYLVLMLLGLYAIYKLHWLSPASALLIMGFVSLIVSIYLINVNQTPGTPAVEQLSTHEVINDHWRYGRWATGTNLLIWLPSNIYYFLLPIWLGLEASATLKALMNLVMPILHTNAALSILLVPAFVQAKSQRRSESMLISALILMIGGAVLYALFLNKFHNLIISTLYGGQYLPDTGIVLIISALPISAAIVAVLGATLRAQQKPNLVLRCYLISVAVIFSFGFFLIVTRGLQGAALGILSSSIATAASMMWFRYNRNKLNDC